MHMIQADSTPQHTNAVWLSQAAYRRQFLAQVILSRKRHSPPDNAPDDRKDQDTEENSPNHLLHVM